MEDRRRGAAVSAKKYRGIPIEIEAIQYDGMNIDAVTWWIGVVPGAYEVTQSGDGTASILGSGWRVVLRKDEWLVRSATGRIPHAVPDAVFRYAYHEVPVWRPSAYKPEGQL